MKYAQQKKIIRDLKKSNTKLKIENGELHQLNYELQRQLIVNKKNPSLDPRQGESIVVTAVSTLFYLF